MPMTCDCGKERVLVRSMLQNGKYVVGWACLECDFYKRSPIGGCDSGRKD